MKSPHHWMTILLWFATAGAHAQLLPVPMPEPLDLNGRGARPERQAPAVRITEQEAVALARGQFPGNVLRITLVTDEGVARYQLRMENEGKVFTVFVNAQTGEVTGG